MLWHFPKQLIVPPYTIKTLNFGAGYIKNLEELPTFCWWNYEYYLSRSTLLLFKKKNPLPWELLVHQNLKMYDKKWFVENHVIPHLTPYPPPIWAHPILPHLDLQYRTISFHYIYVLSYIFYHNWNTILFLFSLEFSVEST